VKDWFSLTQLKLKQDNRFRILGKILGDVRIRVLSHSQAK